MHSLQPHHSLSKSVVGHCLPGFNQYEAVRKCDLLKVTMNCDPARSRTRDNSVHSPCYVEIHVFIIIPELSSKTLLIDKVFDLQFKELDFDI